MNRYLEIVRDVVPSPEPVDAPPSPAINNGVTAPSADTDLTPARAAGASTVNISEEEFRFSIWSDEQLANGVIAIDSETTLIQGNEVPDLALISVSDGDCHYLVHPDKLAAFLLQHQHHHFVCHNASFDFWVVEQYLRERSASEALAAWWNMADVGHLHDTMLLDMLVDLGKNDSFPRPRNLAVVSNHYTGLSIDKSDPYRLRYGEIIGKDWGSVDPGFFSYAIKDAIVTHRAYARLEQEAKELVKPHLADILPDAVDRFGRLTESLQVRAAIALAAISRHGMHLDQEAVSTVQHRIRDELDVQIEYLKGTPCAAGLFKTTKDGQIRVTPKAETPSLSTKRLVEVLVRIAEETDQDITIKRTPKGSVSTAAKTWSQYSDVHPFILHWVKMAELAKLCQFFRNLQHAVIHPRYTPLVRTGRTSCTNPNIQQLPRSGGFREMVVASPGHYLLAVDYSFVELRTLAAVCEFRYGSSTLADVIRGGTDPHVHTAAMFANMSLQEFQRLEVVDPQRYATLRQRAKALNFGIPGGLGAASLVAYARSAYGVEMSFDDAQKFRQRLIQDVYPELTAYLAEDTYSLLAQNLKSTTDLCRQYFRSEALLSSVRRIVAGKKLKTNGKPYNEHWVRRVWAGLAVLCNDSQLQVALELREGNDQLMRKLFWSPVVTLTGRLRGRVGFTQSRNTRFQGLAADGAKLAIWTLIKSGYRVTAFIHDEVLIELPVDCDHTAESSRIDRIMCESMELVTGAVPVACEYAMAERWYKEAKAVFRDGRLVVWQPEGVQDAPRT